MTVVALPPPAPAPPAITEHDGRPVTWSPWTGAMMFLCPGGAMACACGSTTDTVTTFGTVGTLPGETYPVPAETRAQRRAARTLDPTATVAAAAWPVKRLYASLCTACGDLAVYDMGQLGDRWDVVGADAAPAQLGLFE